MPAKTNTAPTALGGTNNSPAEPASNRAGQDLAMPRTPRHSRERSAVPHTPRHSRASRSPRARPAWGNPEPAPLLSPRAGSGLNRGPSAQAFPRHSRERGNPEPQAPEILSATTPPVSAFPAIPGTAHQGRPSGDGTHCAAAPAFKATRATTRTREIPAREILFIDPGVSDIETFLGHLRPEVEAILLDPVRPAARQMAAALAGERDLAAIHIIAHGAPGRVDFAAGQWSAETLADDAEDLTAIGQALAASGDLRLWSCRTAAGPAGAAFVAGLTQASGADTAAATGLVGAAALGGVWQLTVHCGCASARPPLTAAGVSAYAGVLVTITTGTTNPTTVTIAGDDTFTPAVTPSLQTIYIAEETGPTAATYIILGSATVAPFFDANTDNFSATVVLSGQTSYTGFRGFPDVVE
jgi:hypothetical protein